MISMKKTKIGVMSDLHLFNKTTNIERALTKMQDSDIVLIVGDVADRAREKQYDILLNLIGEKLHSTPVYCVSGNHDNPAKDDTGYRQFEGNINNEYHSIVDECGAFYKQINEYIDVIGLNPLYHQKYFFFPDKGLQLGFLQKKLAESTCKYHIVMCHPPLIAHNPQRTAGMTPYIVFEQDRRLQKIIDESQNVIFLSGHTHVAPTLEIDETHGNLYINDGSICPTTQSSKEALPQQGNVTLIDISESVIHVTIKGIHSEIIFVEEHIDLT